MEDPKDAKGGAKSSKGQAILEERRARGVDSMGWLTESAVMPKKQRVIEGVGASSIVELRAELYRTQEEARKLREGLPVDLDERRSRKPSDLFSKVNAGVEERAKKDKLHLKEQGDPDTYAALEKKAAIYQKLLDGDLPDEEDKEKYSVDFLRKSFEGGTFRRKGFLEDEEEEEREEGSGAGPSGNRKCEDGSGPGSADRVAAGAGQMSAMEEEAARRRQEHKQVVMSVNMETKEAREKAQLLKEQRRLQAERNRDTLRAAFLKKQAHKLKVMNKGGTSKPE